MNEAEKQVSPKTPFLPKLSKDSAINPGGSVMSLQLYSKLEGSQEADGMLQDDRKTKKAKFDENIESPKSRSKEKRIPSQKHLSSFDTHDQLLETHRSQIRSVALMVFLVSIFLMLERIFWEPIQTAERRLLIRLQDLSGLTYIDAEGRIIKQSNFFFFTIANIQEFTISVLLCTHIVATIYFNFSPRIAIKMIFTQYSAWYVLTLLQLLYSSPQPFWIDRNIITYLCDRKYDTPSDSCFLFLMFFCTLVYQLNNEWSQRPDYTSKGLACRVRFFYLLIAIFEIVYGALVYISGQCFIIDLTLGFAYFIVVFSIFVYFEPWLDRLVTMFLEEFVEIKHYVFYVMGVIFTAEVLALLFEYEKSENEKIEYIRNFFICFEQSSLLSRGFLGETNKFPFNKTIGRTATFTQSSVLLCIVGITFSLFPQPFKNRSRGVNNVLLHLSFIPFWTWALFQGWLMNQTFLEVIGFTQYLGNCLFCLSLHLWVFRFVGARLVKRKPLVVPTTNYFKLR